MAVKASCADAGNRRTAILGCIELLLWEGRQQKAQPFQLPGSEYSVEHLVVIRERDQLTLRDITQLGARGQVNGWRKLGQEVIRQIEIHVEPGQVPPVLLLDRVDQEVRKDEAALPDRRDQAAGRAGPGPVRRRFRTGPGPARPAA